MRQRQRKRRLRPTLLLQHCCPTVPVQCRYLAQSQGLVYFRVLAQDQVVAPVQDQVLVKDQDQVLVQVPVEVQVVAQASARVVVPGQVSVRLVLLPLW